MIVNKWTIINHFLPRGVCLLCGTSAAIGLCPACERDIVLNRHACPRCALPIPDAQAGLTCGQCLQQPPPYRLAYSYAVYAPPLDRMIQQLKFRQKLAFAALLGHLMAVDIRARGLTLPELLVPVPLHAQRLRQRGYNQALELARPIARELGITLDFNLCRRRKPTAEQTGLHARQRRSNIRDAFVVSRPLTGRYVTIVDDVMTTGSTVNELARQLQHAGASRVDVWVCARASI